MAKVAEGELLALKAKYLAAHREYERCIAVLSEAGLRSAASLPNTVLDDVAKAFRALQVARQEYRAVLFEAAFGSDSLVN
jgi:hypothetical protein